NLYQIGIITHCYDGDKRGDLKVGGVHPDDFLHDICLVSPVHPESFFGITSPGLSWWTTAATSLPSQITEDIYLQIATDRGMSHSNAQVVDGIFLEKDFKEFAVFQGYRVHKPKPK